MKPLIVSPSAEADMVEAAAYYEAQRVGFARSFVAEIRAVFERVEDNPKLYVRVADEVRRAPMHRFPFGVFYVEEPETTWVIAVLDLRREPSTQGRVLALRRRDVDDVD